MTEEEEIDTTEVGIETTIWDVATETHMPAEVHQAAIEAEEIWAIMIDLQEITMVDEMAHATMIDPAMITDQDKEEKGKNTNIHFISKQFIVSDLDLITITEEVAEEPEAGQDPMMVTEATTVATAIEEDLPILT